MKSILPSRSEPKLILLHFYSSFYLGLTDSSSSVSLPEGDAQRPGLWEGWEIEFLLPGLGRIFCINTSNVQKLNRITKAEGLFQNPTLPKLMLAAVLNNY